MSDTRLAVFNNDGQSAYIDMRTEATNGEGRQVVVFGDPSINANVAAVQASDPSTNIQGVVVRDVNTSAIVSRLGSTLFVSLDPGHLLGSVTANAGSGTFTVAFDPGHELGSIKGSNSSLAVFLDPGHLLGSVTANAGSGSFNVQFDPGHTLGKMEPGVGTFQVYLPDTGHTLGIVGDQSTLVIPITTAGNFNGVSTLGKTLAGPTTSRVLKIYAFSITTTAQVSLTAKLTNGAGSAPTVFYEAALQAPAQGISGTNMSVTPPGYLFATASGSTLSLLLDSASLVHYMVSYFEESA